MRKPSRVPEPTHRYKPGQSVSLSPGFGFGPGARGEFKVVATLPYNGSHFVYRIRNSAENFERVVQENEISAKSAA